MKNKDILVDVLDLMDRLDMSVRLYKIQDMEDFLCRDELEQDGLAYKIQVIAETLGKVSDDFKDGHTEIPWKNIKGMRNQLSHNYGQNNYRLIYYLGYNILEKVYIELFYVYINGDFH